MLGYFGDKRPCKGGFSVCQEVTGYQTKRWRVALCHAGSVLTAGLLLVLFHWKPSLEVQAKCKPCALGQADWVIIRVSPKLGRGLCHRRPRRALGMSLDVPCHLPTLCLTSQATCYPRAKLFQE